LLSLLVHCSIAATTVLMYYFSSEVSSYSDSPASLSKSSAATSRSSQNSLKGKVDLHGDLPVGLVLYCAHFFELVFFLQFEGLLENLKYSAEELVDLIVFCDDVGILIEEAVELLLGHVKLSSFNLLGDETLEEDVAEFEDQVDVDAFGLVVADELPDTCEGLEEVELTKVEDDVVFPHAPVLAVHLEGLFQTSESFSVLVELNVASRDVGPGFVLLVVD